MARAGLTTAPRSRCPVGFRAFRDGCRFTEHFMNSTIDRLAAAVQIAEAMDPVQPRSGRPTKITETDRQRVRELRQQGQSVRQIAKACGLSVGSVSGILRA